MSGVQSVPGSALTTSSSDLATDSSAHNLGQRAAGLLGDALHLVPLVVGHADVADRRLASLWPGHVGESFRLLACVHRNSLSCVHRNEQRRQP